MDLRAASLALASTLALANVVSAATADDRDANRREAWERQLHAQIDRTDKDIQVLESRLFALENNHSGNDAAREAEKVALRDQIQRMDHEQEPIEACLEKLEHDAPLSRVSCPFHDEGDQAAPMQAAEPMRSAPESPPPPMIQPHAPPPPAPPPPPQQLGPMLRQAADPAPYEKAIISRVSMFHYNSYRWVPVGTRQLVVYNTWDDAYLLDFAADCPGLLTAERIKVENFSTKVVAGRDGVIADGQRCAIVGISELNAKRLPSP